MSGATSSADLDEAPARTIYLNQPQQSKFRDNWVRYGAIALSPGAGSSLRTPQPGSGPSPCLPSLPDLSSGQYAVPLPSGWAGRRTGLWRYRGEAGRGHPAAAASE